MKSLKKVTMITACAAIAGSASAALAVNVSADEFTPDTAVVYSEPVIAPDTDCIPKVTDEPVTVTDADVAPEVTDESVTVTDEIIIADDTAVVLTVNASQEGTYWNGSSFIELLPSNVCNVFMVDAGQYLDICGTGGIWSTGATGYTFTATFHKNQWYHIVNGHNVVEQNKSVTIQGNYDPVNGIITVDLVKFIKN